MFSLGLVYGLGGRVYSCHYSSWLGFQNGQALSSWFSTINSKLACRSSAVCTHKLVQSSRSRERATATMSDAPHAPTAATRTVQAARDAPGTLSRHLQRQQRSRQSSQSSATTTTATASYSGRDEPSRSEPTVRCFGASCRKIAPSASERTRRPFSDTIAPQPPNVTSFYCAFVALLKMLQSCIDQYV